MLKEDIVDIPFEDANFCVLDVETTGLSPANGGIIEIALVRVENMKVTDTYTSLVNPGRLIPYFITKLTGISDDDVFDAPYFEEIADKVEQFIADDILIAHNISFDKSFLRKEFISCGREPVQNLSLCTVKLARKLYPQLGSKSLGSVCRHLGLKNTSAHRALGDAKVTARAFIKMAAEAKAKHKIFTVGEIVNFQFSPSSKRENLRIKPSLSKEVSELPDAPGVYYFINSKKEIIYIGKAKSLKDRIKSYFSTTAPRKSKKIIQQASHLKIEITNSELTALLTEAETIKIIKPKHNTQLKKYGNKYFLRVIKNHTFPSIEICNYFDFDGNDYFGLFITRKKAEAVHEVITKTFLIRECTDAELAKNRVCLLSEIDRCIAPCINNDKSEYAAELERMYEFMFGKNQFALNRLLNKMKEYSSQLKFEKASEVKQLIDLILAQTHKSSLLSEPVNKANVLFEISEKFSRDYILMISGKIYVKQSNLNKKDLFDEALEDYFADTRFENNLPDNEDLEKMKITLNWLIRNRNKVRIFYLKDYEAKEELYKKILMYSRQPSENIEATFDIKEFMTADSLIQT